MDSYASVAQARLIRVHMKIGKHKHEGMLESWSEDFIDNCVHNLLLVFAIKSFEPNKHRSVLFSQEPPSLSTCCQKALGVESKILKKMSSRLSYQLYPCELYVEDSLSYMILISIFYPPTVLYVYHIQGCRGSRSLLLPEHIPQQVFCFSLLRIIFLTVLRISFVIK